MLLPSYYEGFGLAIIEAMAYALPVICTRVGVANDLFRFDTLRRLIIPILDRAEMIEGIGDRISFLRNDTAGKDEIAAAGRSIVEKEYPMELWKNKMSAVLGLQ